MSNPTDDRPRLNWLHKLRLRALAVFLGLVLGAFAIVGLASVPAWPVFGVAIITAAAVVNSMASRLSQATCAACGQSLSGQPAGTYGVTCPDCGAINQHLDPIRLAGEDGSASDQNPIA